MAEIRFNGSFLHIKGSPMALPARIGLYLALWLFAEFAAFFFIAHLVGFLGALLLCVLTSIAGALMLRDVGFSAAVSLRREMTRRRGEDDLEASAAMLDGALAGIGSVLLILPGFVTDFFGLALAAPSIRSRLAAWLQNRPSSGGRGAAGSKTIELTPREWTRIDGSDAGERGEAQGRAKKRRVEKGPRGQDGVSDDGFPDGFQP